MIEAGRIDRAHFRLDHQVDDAVRKHRRSECETDAEWLPLDGDRCVATAGAAISLGHGHREFAAGQEVRGLAGKSHQRRLGERRDGAFVSSASSVTLKSAPNALNVRDTMAKLSMIEPSLLTGSP